MPTGSQPGERDAARPRLLIATPDYPPARGGIQVVAHRLAEGLDAFERLVVTFDERGAREFDSQGSVRVARTRSGERLGPARNLVLNAAVLAHAARFRPHIVLSAHMVLAPSTATIRRVGGAAVAQYFYAKEIGNRPRLASFAAAKADLTIGISAYTAQLLTGCGVDASSVVLIPPGVDLPAQTGPLAAEHPTLLTIARLQDRYKGHDVVMRALAIVRRRVPDVEWVIVGDGPLRGELEGMARELGVQDSVRFLGSLADEQRNQWLRRCRLLVMPSRLPGGGLAGEGYGIVYLEAGAFGKPVVAGNVAGPLDAVADGESGLLVDPTDHAAVAEAIIRLLLDDALAARLGEAGRRRAHSLAWPLIAARVQDLLLDALPGRAPA